MDQCIINIQNLSFQYNPTTPIFDRINFSLQTSNRTAILGSSGSGKTTLISLISGLIPIQSGSIKVMETSLESASDEEKNRLRRENIGFIFQDFRLIPSLTALENVMLALDINGEDHVEDKSQHWLDALGLGKRTHHYPEELSGGEKQRVGIARAMVKSPNIVLADEPTGNLDDYQSKEISELLLKTFEENNTSVILVTHDQMVADILCPKKTYLESGVLT